VGTETDLEALSSRELHDMAMRRAVHHGDVKFLWDLLREIPAAEEVAGNPGEADQDMLHLVTLISDAVGSGEGEIGEALRPMYIDYLKKHPPKHTPNA
jgi:hypothetical protein